MFGINRMYKQRERLYLRTQILEKRAKISREEAIDNLVGKATSPAGLLASFVLGATTQLDITRNARKNLLNGASKEVLSFVVAQLTAYLTLDAKKATTEPQKAAASQTPVGDFQTMSATEKPSSSDQGKE
jgi:hypothetical protein